MGKTAHSSEQIRFESIILVNQIFWTVQWLSNSPRNNEKKRANRKKSGSLPIARHTSHLSYLSHSHSSFIWLQKLTICTANFPYTNQRKEAKCALLFMWALFRSIFHLPVWKWARQISCLVVYAKRAELQQAVCTHMWRAKHTTRKKMLNHIFS